MSLKVRTVAKCPKCSSFFVRILERYGTYWRVRCVLCGEEFMIRTDQVLQPENSVTPFRFVKRRRSYKRGHKRRY